MGGVTALAPPHRVRRRAPAGSAIARGKRQHREPLLTYVLRGDLLTILSSPITYSTIVPFALLDAWVSLYQAVCFRAWGLARVRRRDFFAIDRHQLPYLNGVEKVNCLYCSYANGLVGYVREIAARTEQYWCPIHHARHTRQAHGRYAGFVAYGDAKGYREGLPSLRAKLKK